MAGAATAAVLDIATNANAEKATAGTASLNNVFMSLSRSDGISPATNMVRCSYENDYKKF